MSSARYARYTGMVDSGVRWLGSIPEHWRVIASRRLFDQRKERLCPGDVQLTASQKYGVIPQAEFMEREGQKVMQVFTGADILKHVEPGDFVISMRSFQGGLEWCGYRGCVSSAYVGITPVKQVVPGFFRYLFKSDSYIQALQSTSNLVRDGQALRFQNFAQVGLPLISEDEQIQIAAFLDHETAKIDTLIEKQEQLIALLQEKRQAVISHAVTKGLNPDAPMRDSGVEWLGEIPAHWEITKSKYLFEFVTSGSRGWAEYYSDEGALFFRIANLTRETIEPKLLSVQNVLAPPGSEGERSKIREDDILISITADLGSVCVADSRIAGGYVSQHVSLCRPNRKVDSPRWLGYVLLSEAAREQLLGAGYGGTKIQLSLDDVREILIARPGPDEQRQIERYVDAQMDRFARLILVVEKGIELLKERRSALISAAVTGKIDVRTWKAPEAV